MTQPLVSVVTPFYNTSAYLAQCIESVLRQTYPHFEYVLVDNCSTDGSAEIAQAYATKDSRIRLIRQPQLLPQVQNYNTALTYIAEASKYCKIVQADDFIFPECLRLMVDVFECSKSIGLVSSYDLKGNTVRGSDFPYPTPVLAGKEMGRLYLRAPVWVFGSPSTVMYRSSLVRDCRAFYSETQLHEDTEKCMEILKDWDFGFVHQVLSFLRLDNEGSISARYRAYQPDALDRYIIVRRYALDFLEKPEGLALRKSARRKYYRVLAKQALGNRGPEFWRYHKQGLATLDESLDRLYLFLHVIAELLWLASNPGLALVNALKAGKRRLSAKKQAASRGLAARAGA